MFVIRGRDPVAFIKEVSNWDSMVAAFGGAVKDGMPGVDGEIFKNPRFEQLEHAGLKNPMIRDAVEKLRSALARTPLG